MTLSSVRVISDNNYTTLEGHAVHIHIGDQFQLVSKTSSAWWRVQKDCAHDPFYIPAAYVEELAESMVSREGSSEQLGASSEYDEPSADYSSNSSDEERGECFDNPVYALPAVTFHGLEYSLGSSEDEKGSRTSPGPDYVNMKIALNCHPPVPSVDDVPVRTLETWEEHEDSLGRRYFFHPTMQISSWKPPRKVFHFPAEPDCVIEPLSKVARSVDGVQLRLHEDSVCSKDYNGNHETNTTATITSVETETKVTAVMYSDLPPSPSPQQSGITPHGRHVNFMPRFNRCSSLMEDHRGGEEASLNGSVIIQRDFDQNEKENATEEERRKSASLPMPRRPPASKEFLEKRQLIANKISQPERAVRTRSVMLLSEAHINEFDRIGPKIGGMRNSKTIPAICVGKLWKADRGGILEGFLHVTKFSDGGRRLKKQWAALFVVLTDTTIFMFKPPFVPGQSPEIFVDLPGSTIKWSKEKSHKKNVFEISAADGSQILMQDDNISVCRDWVNNIVEVVGRLPGAEELLPVKVLPLISESVKLESPGSPRLVGKLIGRTRSTKIRPEPSPSDEVAAEILQVVQAPKKKKSVDEMENADIKVKKMKIIERLKNFFSRRPTLESLKAKGIIRDGPVFGCNFLKLCEHEKSNVPAIVKRCIVAIERKDLRTDGIYRVSGNLSQVQKLRFQIDQNKFSTMESEEDVNVLTGLLKLFFRELKEPMIPFNLYTNLMKSNKIQDKNTKDKRFKELVGQIPGPNAETLRYLFQHLYRVADFGDQNRMKIPNLAIVFGPTLMWPEIPSTNLATDMLCQNQVVEYLLLNFHALFETYDHT